MDIQTIKERLTQFVVPFFIAILTMAALVSVYNLAISKKDLITVEGTVYTVRLEKELSGRATYDYPLYICLTTGAKYKIMDSDLFEEYRRYALTNLKSGDEVTIFKRDKTQTLLGWGTSNLIYQLEEDGEVIMPISVMRTNFAGLLILEVVLLVMLIIIQVKKVKRKHLYNGAA